MRAASERALMIALLASAGVAAADGIDTEVYRSTPALGAETFQLEPADVGTSGEWLATSAVSFARNPMTITTSRGSDRPVISRAMLELGGAFAFLGRFEAGVRVPVFQQSGDSPDSSVFHVPAADGTALGDVGLHTRVRLMRAPKTSLALGLQLSLPTATDGQYVGSGPTGRARALFALRATPTITLTFNGGGVLRGETTYANTDTVPGGAIAITQGSGFTWGAGLSFRPAAHVALSLEAFGDIVSAGEMQGWRKPMEALAGARYELANGFSLGAAVGRGISDELGTAQVRGLVTLGFAPSRARAEAVANDVEEELPAEVAKKTPGKSDAVASDARDKCPFEAEDVDGFEDEDGCPDTDNDGDAIKDAQDKCPNDPEVINGVKDNDGCPDEAGTTIAVSGSMTPTQAAEQTFKQGRELMKQKQYAKACAAFEHSQRLDPQQGTQFNLAACYIEIGKLATAWTIYRELSRVDTNADRKSQASAAATKLAKRVPKMLLSLGTIPDGTNVFMNGADATALLNIETPVDFGTYELVAGAPGRKSWRKKITIDEEGKVTKLTITLESMK